jgi:excisionase family DNA binding protein
MEPLPAPEPTVLTVQEVAAILRCSEATVIARIKTGTLPGRKISPRMYRIPRSRFEAWLEDQEGGDLGRTAAAD